MRAKSSETLQAAIDECNRLNVNYRYELSNNNHFMFYIDGCKMITISFGMGRDNHVLKAVRADVRRAVRLKNLNQQEQL